MKILVTGCLGFIASFLCKYIIHNTEHSVIGIARNSNQRHLKRLDDIIDNPRFNLIYKDLYLDDVSDLFEDIDVIFHLAARTFVDHSVRAPEPFIKDNIVVTYKLLEESRKYKKLQNFFVISTDEVYGSILKGAYDENSPLNPSNVYSATKSAGDMLSLAYHATYSAPIIITRTENVYGPYQHPQKAIPTFVRKALNDEPLPIYGDGSHSRQWLHVEDKCRALMTLLEKGKVGEIYHIAGNQELTNLELANMILRILDKPEDLITFVPDHDVRPGHDRRYCLASDKIRALGWQPKYTLEDGIKKTVAWYRDNMWWQQ